MDIETYLEIHTIRDTIYESGQTTIEPQKIRKILVGGWPAVVPGQLASRQWKLIALSLIRTTNAAMEGSR